MVERITAFRSADGRLHMDKNEAEFADFSLSVQQDAADFLKQRQHIDEDGLFQRLLCDWELWRLGGFAGWLKHCEQEQADLLAEDAQGVEQPEATAVRGAPRAPRRQVTEKNPHRKHVGVIGLDAPLHTVIEREFADCFKLTLYDRDCIARLEGLKHCHKVFAMTNCISHKHVETLRALGQEPYRVAGGITTLKNALTDYYAA